jgi:hypothetical protein
MRYLIVLDARSVVGQIFAEHNDGLVTAGGLNHPMLECSEIDLSIPAYIFAIRNTRAAGGRNQRIYLPHGSVVSIQEFDVNNPLRGPIGFHSTD